jgi:hypothetical protein
MPPSRHPMITLTNDEVGWFWVIPDTPRSVCPYMKCSHLQPDVTAFDTAPISTLPLVGRQAEEYPRPREVSAPPEPRITAWT